MTQRLPVTGRLGVFRAMVKSGGKPPHSKDGN